MDKKQEIEGVRKALGLLDEQLMETATALTPSSAVALGERLIAHPRRELSRLLGESTDKMVEMLALLISSALSRGAALAMVKKLEREYELEVIGKLVDPPGEVTSE